jgi:hypothetical protein
MTTTEITTVFSLLIRCPLPLEKEQCPAGEFKAGKLCWFINGTLCECISQSKWQNKMEFCQKCEVFSPLIGADSIQRSVSPA